MRVRPGRVTGSCDATAEVDANLHPHVALTGESPIWDPDRQTLWWIDIQGQWLLGWNERTGPVDCLPLPSQPGLVALATCGALVLGLEDGLWRCDPERRALRFFCPVEADDPRTRINDGKADAQGRLWFGTMEKHGSGDPIGALYCYDSNIGLTRLREGVAVPNTIVPTPDGRLFFADSPTGTIVSWSIARDRAWLSDLREFVAFANGEKPNGASVDVEGCFWVAVVGGSRVDRYNPSGIRLTSIPLPVVRPTMAAFGGSDGRTLFVTSQRRFLNHKELATQPLAGRLIALPAPTQGHGAFRYRVGAGSC